MFQTFDPPSDRGFASRHLPALRERMGAQGLTGLVVPHDDAYLNEYLPDDAERLMWVSGFSGSAGEAIVMADRAVMFTDGRYTLQVREQVDDAFFEYERLEDGGVAAWIAKNAGPDDTIGYDPMLHSPKSVEALKKAAAKSGAALRALGDNPIDQAWTERPDAPCEPVLPHPDVREEARVEELADAGVDIVGVEVLARTDGQEAADRVGVDAAVAAHLDSADHGGSGHGHEVGRRDPRDGPQRHRDGENGNRVFQAFGDRHDHSHPSLLCPCG